MKLTKKIIAAAMGLGILFWFLDVFVERLAAPDRSWSEVLLNLDRPHDLFMRTLIVLICFGFGWLLAEVVRGSQRKLQESKENLRITLHSIGDAVIAADLQGNVTRMNPVAEELTGWTLQQAEGKPLQEVFQIVNAYTREPAENPVEEVLETGKVVGLANHTLLLGREGREYQIEDSGAPIVDGQGGIRGVVLVFRDVTKEYQQKSLLKATLNALAHPFLVINTETYQVEIFNPAAEKASGDPRLKHCYALGHRLDQPCSGEEHPCPIQLVKETKESVVVEHIHLTDDGQPRYVEIHAHPILDYQGNVIQLVEYSLDITERKEAQKQLWESREKYRSLVENSLQGMVIAKADPVRLVYVSPPMEEITGYPPDELTAFNPQQIQELIHPLDRQKFFGSFNRRLAGEELPSRAEYRFINAQGDIRWIELFSTKIDYQGAPATQTVFIDITERKKAEAALVSYSEELETRVERRTRELRRAQQKLVRRERLAVLGQLAGGVGHEMRNPLAVMSNAIYFLKLSQQDAPPKVVEYLTILEDEIGHAEKIVSDLLGYSGAIQADPEAVSLPAVIDQLLMRVELPSAVEHSVELGDSLPAVQVDKNHLLQILENLVENSCQAMPAGGSLRITAQREGDRVSIAVEDTGAGIIPENQEKVFEPLFTTKARGIGLGLAISQKLAEANQGEIGFRSIPGEKTVFWVNLPLSLKVEV